MDFKELSHVIPFMALATKVPLEIHNRPLLTRLAEQSVVGIVAAVFVIYANDIRREEQIKGIEKQQVLQITAIKDSIILATATQKEAEIRLLAAISSLSGDVSKIRNDLYKPKITR